MGSYSSWSLPFGFPTKFPYAFFTSSTRATYHADLSFLSPQQYSEYSKLWAVQAFRRLNAGLLVRGLEFNPGWPWEMLVHELALEQRFALLPSPTFIDTDLSQPWRCTLPLRRQHYSDPTYGWSQRGKLKYKWRYLSSWKSSSLALRYLENTSFIFFIFFVFCLFLFYFVPSPTSP